MTNVSLLNEKIDSSGLKKGYIAECLKLSRQGMANKISGKTDFTVDEAFKMKDLLNLNKDEFVRIFLA